MIAHDVFATIRSRIADSIDIAPADEGRIAISLPITYDDGEHCTCYAIRENGGWLLRDYGDTITRASFRDVDLLGKGYVSRLDRIAGFYGAKRSDNQLEMRIESVSDIGQAVFSFAQVCLAVQSLSKSKPERPKREADRRFEEGVSAILEKYLPQESIARDWHHPTLDPQRVYEVDFMVEPATKIPWLIFKANSSQSCLKSAIAIHHYREKLKFRSLAVSVDESSVPANSAIPLRDVVDEWVPTLDGDMLEQVVAEKIVESR